MGWGSDTVQVACLVGGWGVKVTRWLVERVGLSYTSVLYYKSRYTVVLEIFIIHIPVVVLANIG